MKRFTFLLLGLLMTGAVSAQELSRYQQAERFIEQLAANNNGVITWLGSGLGTSLTQVNQRRKAPLKLTQRKNEPAFSDARLSEDSVEVRLSFYRQDGVTSLESACTGSALSLTSKEIAALEKQALKRLRGLKRSDPNNPLQEALATQWNEVWITSHGICLRPASENE